MVLLWGGAGIMGVAARRSMLTMAKAKPTPFIAANNAGTVYTSEDATSGSWTGHGSLFSSGGTVVTDMAWSPELGILVAVGYNGKLATSSDGKNWTERTSTFTTTIIRAVTWAPSFGVFIAVGGVGKVATSPDGINWTARSTLYGSSYDFWGVTASTSKCVIVGDSSACVTTTTPTGSWSTSEYTNTNGVTLYDITWAPSLGRFVVCGNGSWAHSTDAITWSSSSTLEPHQAVAWSPSLGMFVMVTASGLTWSSTNGTSWTNRNNSFSGSAIYDVAWSPTAQKFVIVGASGKVNTSTSGTAWGSITGPWGTNESNTVCGT